MSAVLLSIGCTAEASRPSLPAPSSAAVDSTPVSVSQVLVANKPVPASIVSPCPARAVSPPHPDSDARNAWTRFNDSIEVAALSTVQGKVCRVDQELRIQLLDGRSVVFKDDYTPGMKFAVPRYAGYLETIHSHVIHILQYEGSGAYLVVDDSTGDSTIVFGKPVASPDGKRFVVTSMAGAGAGYDASMIEVWQIVGRKPEKEFFYSTEGGPWEASDPVWRDSVTIDFLKNRFVSFTEPSYVQTPGRLKRIGTTWVLDDSLSASELQRDSEKRSESLPFPCNCTTLEGAK
jgi:hypothetical protein